MDDLETQIKQVIIESLNLEDMKPEDIDTEAPLFGDGLGLDSIDALELGLAIKNNFNIQISAPSDEIKEHFYSVATIANFIRSQENRAE